LKKLGLLLSLALLLVAVPYVNAQTGTIRIDPVWPIMLASPADFEIWVEGAGDPTHDPNVLLVMSQGCYDGLTGDVVVSWTWPSSDSVTFSKAAFGANAVSDNSAKVPPTGTTEGGCYTVASLKDHLDEGLSVPLSADDTIYWAMSDFLGVDPLTGEKQTFTVTLPSTAPRMLVYALGKSDPAGDFDMKVPPTRPGFMVPELGTMLLVIASFSAFAIYAIARRKVHLK